MNLLELVQRNAVPIPWAEGDNIPWNEPEFSRRMLVEHLTQTHDAASRRFEIIDRQVNWIHTTLLDCQPTTILDLGCGPGLYSSRLAFLGHSCHGIDYSPASIDFAIESAQRDHLPCTYVCRDIRKADFSHKNGLVMLIYGEFNVFRPEDAKLILKKAWQALKPGGWLLLEPHPFKLIQQMGEKTPSWFSSLSGLFSERPHVVLQENFWEALTNIATIRYFVIDVDTLQVSQYAQSMQAYQDEEYCELLSSCGFAAIEFLPGISGDFPQGDLIGIMARRQD